MESYRTAPLITGQSRLLSVDVIANADEGEQQVTSQEVRAEDHQQTSPQFQEVNLQTTEAPEVEAVDAPPEPDDGTLPYELRVLQQQLTEQSEGNKKLTRVRPYIDCVGCIQKNVFVIFLLMYVHTYVTAGCLIFLIKLMLFYCLCTLVYVRSYIRVCRI